VKNKNEIKALPAAERSEGRSAKLEAETSMEYLDLEIRPARVNEYTRLLSWLDAGLRGRRMGRLAAEYPDVFRADHAREHIVATELSGFAAHAVGRSLAARTGAVSFRLGMLGSIYTDAAYRGRGLARACVEAAVAQLAGEGAHAVALWSDLHAFYARLGFEPAGVENLYRVRRSECEQVLRSLRKPDAVTEFASADGPALDALYASKPVAAVRKSGKWEQRACTPDCTILVARREEKPIAYAACGRGDDFSGVVHEWAGEAGGVAACLHAFLEKRSEIVWLTGPIDEEPVPVLRATGARLHRGFFALLRITNATALWEEIKRHATVLSETHLSPVGPDGRSYQLRGACGERTLQHRELLQLLFGPHASNALIGVLSPEAQTLAREWLPLPLFVWGFDSI